MSTRRRRAQQLKRRLPARAAPVYVPLIHGVGTKTEADWCQRSVTPLVDWWLLAGRGATESAGCPRGCRLSKGHRHVEISTDRGPVRVDVDPIHWNVTEPGRLTCAWLVLKAGLLIGIVNVIAAVPRIFHPLAEDTAAGDLLVLSRQVMQVLLRAVGLLLRGAVMPLLAVAAAAFTLFVKPLRRALADGLIWAIDGSERQRLIDDVCARIDAEPGASVVLVGHSQGGSIAAEVHRRLSGRRRVALVTVGSGHALLQTLNVVTPSWSLRRSLAVWFLVATWLAAVGVLMAVVLPTLAAGLAATTVDLGRTGAFVWLLDLQPERAIELYGRALSGLMAGIRTELPHGAASVSVTVGLIGFCVTSLSRALIGSRALDVQRALHTAAPGVDIVASHDPVCASMAALDRSDRIRVIAQTGCMTLDHSAYFENAAVVLPEIVRQIEQAAGRDPAASPPGDDRLLRARLSTYRALRPVIVLFALTLVSPATVLPWWLAMLVFVGVGALACVAVGRLSRRSLRRIGAAYTRSPVAVAESAVMRARRRSPRWAFAQFALALPLVGGGAAAAYGAGVTKTPQPQLVEQPSGAAFLTGLVLAATALLALNGSRQADKAAAAGLAVAALLWHLHDTSYGSGVAIACLAAAVWAAWRVARFPEPLHAHRDRTRIPARRVADYGSQPGG